MRKKGGVLSGGEVGPEEERLHINCSENNIREKNQSGSMAPLGVFSMSLCTNGMVPENPLGQKDPCNLTWIKDEQAGGALGDAFYTNQLCVQSGHESALKGQMDHQSKKKAKKPKPKLTVE